MRTTPLHPDLAHFCFPPFLLTGIRQDQAWNSQQLQSRNEKPSQDGPRSHAE